LTEAQAERYAETLPADLIEANVAYLDTPEARGINSRPAWLVSQLKAGAYPPQVARKAEPDPSRFIGGKYAEFIEH
jgi:hypothetical protein